MSSSEYKLISCVGLFYFPIAKIIIFLSALVSVSTYKTTLGTKKKNSQSGNNDPVTPGKNPKFEGQG